ncbi:MAG: exosortase T [Hyphomicrobiaceae bacterium]
MLIVAAPLMVNRFAPAALAAATLLLAGAVLALEPIRWLLQTWTDPAYDSNGALVFILVAALGLWSATSPLASTPAPGFNTAAALLLASAVTRLGGQILAVNVIGALTLVLDVYAAGLLLRLDRRRRAISPGWLAVAFAFALPLERIVQRSIGHPLQHASADGACALLGTFFQNVQCMGVRILLDGRDILVDLPCSGARMTLLALMGFALAACLVRPSVKQAVAGAALTLAAAFGANVLRIAVLAVGIAHPESFGGLDVMAAPWHDGIGFAALILALAPVVLWARRQAEPIRPKVCRVFGVPLDALPDRIRNDGWWLAHPRHHAMLPMPLALAALIAALVIVTLPRHPIDVARREDSLRLPGWISGVQGQPAALSDREAAYFTQYGGAAAKMRYGPHSLVLVRTTSPLRHLHAPDECLRGLGFGVRYVGLQTAPTPTAVYRAEGPDGVVYRVDVTFVSDKGHVTTNVATAVWLWLNGQASRWSAVQRISPATLDADRHRQWSDAALAALGIAQSASVPRSPSDPQPTSVFATTGGSR